MSELKIQSPWVIFYEEINALFKDDPDVQVKYDEDNYVIKLYVSKVNKADALMMILPLEREFGNITVKVEVIPPNNLTMDFKETFETAFAGNPCFAFAESVNHPAFGPADYLVFKPEAAQFFVDDLGDIYGAKTILYQDLAKDILKDYDLTNKMHICSALLETEK